MKYLKHLRYNSSIEASVTSYESSSFSSCSSSHLFYLPREIIIYNICGFLTSKELGNLRLCCRWLKEIISRLPLWRQQFPLHLLPYYHKNLKEKPYVTPIYCCYISNFHKCSTLLSKSIFQALPKDLQVLDLSNCVCFHIEDFEHLPKTLNQLILPWNDTISFPLIEYLIVHFPNLNVILNSASRAYSLLYWACFYGYLYIIELLFNTKVNHADVNGLYGDFIQTFPKPSEDITHFGVTPLYIAARQGDKEVVKLLLENGANPNQALPNKKTPLMIASYWNHYDVVNLLLKYGASINQKDRTGKTVIDYTRDTEESQRIYKLWRNNF